MDARLRAVGYSPIRGTRSDNRVGAIPVTPPSPYGVLHQRKFAAVAGDDPTGTRPGGLELAVTKDDQAHPERRQMRAEAVLLIAKTPLPPRKLAQMALLADATEARTLVRQLNQTYETLGRAIRVEQVAGGFRMMTRPALAPWLVRLGHLPQTERLSTPMMETLAVVAYRQPVSRASAEAVRGVACGELLRQLMERDLIRIVGRGEELGRPYLYGTTKRFLQLFGLPHVDALPPIHWQALHEDQTDVDFTSEDFLDDLSTSTKEPVVTTTIVPKLSDAVLDQTTVSTETETHLAVLAPPVDRVRPQDPSAVDDDDDEDWDDDEEEDDDWDDDDDDWDDDEDEDEEDDDEEVDDEEESEEDEEEELDDEIETDDDDDLEEDDWEEVDDDDDEEWEEEDEEWEDDEEEDDAADDDEDWEE